VYIRLADSSDTDCSVFIYLKYSKHGYEISVVGESINTARYAGINVKKIILRTMFISGAICGLAGMIQVSGGLIPNDGVAGRSGLYRHNRFMAGQA
jgi:simple sugar transport system permease protein